MNLLLRNGIFILFFSAINIFCNAQTFEQIATTDAAGPTNSTSVKFSAKNTTSGDLIIVNVAWDKTSVSMSSVTDDKNNIYYQILAGTKDNSNSFATEIWYAYNISGGTKITVTATLSANTSSFLQMYINEYSGIYSAGDPLDQKSSGQANNGAATISTTSKTIGYAGELIYGIELNSGSATGSHGTGFTSRSIFDGNEEDDETIATTGTYSASFNLSAGSGDMTALMATFLPSNAPLPITLSSFTTTYMEQTNSVLISWTVGSQLNNKEFIVEKTLDGTNYTEVAVVPGAGTTPFVQSYSAIDFKPTSGTSYYRLKQVDMDGNSTLFSPSGISIENNEQSHWLTMYPNPVVLNATLIYNSTGGTPLSVNIVDIAGRTVSSFIFSNLQIGANTLSVNTAGLARGIYFLSARDGRQTEYLKFVKQ